MGDIICCHHTLSCEDVPGEANERSVLTSQRVTAVPYLGKERKKIILVISGKFVKNRENVTHGNKLSGSDMPETLGIVIYLGIKKEKFSRLLSALLISSFRMSLYLCFLCNRIT